MVLCAGFPTALPACNSGSSTLHQCICLIYEILRRCRIASTRFAALHGFVSSRAMARLPSQDLRPLAYTEVPPAVGGITLRCISSTINLTLGPTQTKVHQYPFLEPLQVQDVLQVAITLALRLLVSGFLLNFSRNWILRFSFTRTGRCLDSTGNFCIDDLRVESCGIVPCFIPCSLAGVFSVFMSCKSRSSISSAVSAGSCFPWAACCNIAHLHHEQPPDLDVLVDDAE